MNILILAELVTRSGVGNYINVLSTQLVLSGHKVVMTPNIAIPLSEGVIVEKLPNIKMGRSKVLKITAHSKR